MNKQKKQIFNPKGLLSHAIFTERYGIICFHNSAGNNIVLYSQDLPYVLSNFFFGRTFDKLDQT